MGGLGVENKTRFYNLTCIVVIMRTVVFSYGSNSTAQLRARVENPDLKAVPAKADDWERIFCVRTSTWGGAAASLIPLKGCVVYGAAVELSPEELSRLDSYEGGYHTENILISTYDSGEWTPVEAVCYIANSLYWTVPPSEAYLTALHINLREQFGTTMPDYAIKIEVKGVFSKQGNDNVKQCRSNEGLSHSAGKCDISACTHKEKDAEAVIHARQTDILVELISTWVYPSAPALSLPALCVEVNAQRHVKWVMPRAVTGVVSELKAHGISSSAHLAIRLARGWTLENVKAEGSHVEYLDQETLDIFSRLLQV